MAPRPLVAALLAAALAVAGAAGAAALARSEDGGAPVRLTVWRHSGTPNEQRAFAAQVQRFNAAGHGVRVGVRTIAGGDYNDHVQAAAAAGQLPDLLDLDGPTVATYAYQGDLLPLRRLLPVGMLREQLPSLRSQARYDGQTWSVGTFDSGLGLFGDRAQLRSAGVRLPTGPRDAWSAAEFDRVLGALAGHDRDGRVLDVKAHYGVGEWLTYGFTPLVASAGGDLLDPATGRAGGHLDGPGTVRALQALVAGPPTSTRTPTTARSWTAGSPCPGWGTGRTPTMRRLSVTTSSCCRCRTSVEAARRAKARGPGRSPPTRCTRPRPRRSCASCSARTKCSGWPTPTVPCRGPAGPWTGRRSTARTGRCDCSPTSS